jgi:hypothetical protein
VQSVGFDHKPGLRWTASMPSVITVVVISISARKKTPLLGEFVVTGRICDSESPCSWTRGTGLINRVSVWGSGCPL